MKYDSHFSRHELFVASATIAAHATSSTSGFRQRDVRFLVELFTNWMEISLGTHSITIQNTQMARYLTWLVDEGYARKISRKRPPTYRLTRVGLLELITRLVEREYSSEKDNFFFLYYFIKNYRPRIEDLVKAEKKQFPHSLRIELEALLNSDTLLDKAISDSKRELEKLELRIHDAVATTKLVQRLSREGEKFSAIVEQVEELYPYDLNSQKPLTELIANIPPGLQQWELVAGNIKRVEDVWEPTKMVLRAYIKALEKLKADNPSA
ncbi:hypothetical protein OAO01_07275 [Oligoflexia bacterium]|nr:hypothetical protein [Oligoflexia bacterium]